MSKYVKSLLTDHLRNRLSGVDDALLVDVVGLNANANNRLRGVLEAKGIELVVIRNSLAARATEGTKLAPMFEGLTGTAAVCWGGEDIVSLAKTVTKLAEDKDYEPFRARGGVMDGEALSAKQVTEVSKWPSREEQLSLLVGQILGPGARLAGQLNGPGGALASQIKQKAEDTDAPEA
ncbi:MAG: 50S ribosomal protein L10 [Pirellulales bacterium]|nr:50S ribosomal protein L10 [Pirellulales bacterium]